MNFTLVQGADVANLRDKHPNVLMIDVRDQAAHRALHLAHSFCVPLAELELESFVTEHASDTNRPILLICQLGKRAVMAAENLGGRIKNPLFVLEGGLGNCDTGSVELISAE